MEREVNSRVSATSVWQWRVSWPTLAVVLALCGCNNSESISIRENVSLSGGQKVQVQRTLFRNNVWPNLGNGGYQAVMDDWLSLPSFHAQWQSTRDGGRPMSIGVLDGALVVASETRHDLCYCFEHRDAFNARFFKWTDERWIELDASESLLDGLTHNIPLLDWSDASRPGFGGVIAGSPVSEDPQGSSMSLRSYLTHLSGGSCLDTLISAGWLSPYRFHGGTVASGDIPDPPRLIVPVGISGSCSRPRNSP